MVVAAESETATTTITIVDPARVDDANGGTVADAGGRSSVGDRVPTS
tara:strand:+ start:1809 stop:1949 length:141 start_codon:yes stop_codon:yes gene_type:complete